MSMINFIKGILYGISSIMPGLSGSIVASYFGDYQNILTIISNKYYDIKNIKYLLLVFTGIIIGIIAGSKLLLIIYNNLYAFFKLLVVLINILILLKYRKYIKVNLYKIICYFLVILVIFIIFKNVNLDYVSNYLYAPVLYSFGKIFPGVSSTSLLIMANYYDDLLMFFSNPIYILSVSFFKWFIFWFIFMLSSYLFLKVLCYFNKSDKLNIVIIISLFFNIIMLF